MNLKEIAYAHYLPDKRKRRRANTCEGYASALRLHVVPRFGSIKLEEITHESIQEWVDGFELPGDPLVDRQPRDPHMGPDHRYRVAPQAESGKARAGRRRGGNHAPRVLGA